MIETQWNEMAHISNLADFPSPFLYNTLPISTRLTVISIDEIFPIKLPGKLVIRLHSLLCVWKS